MKGYTTNSPNFKLCIAPLNNFLFFIFTLTMRLEYLSQKCTKKGEKVNKFLQAGRPTGLGVE